MYFAGIDIGSVTSKIVVVDSDSTVLVKHCLPGLPRSDSAEKIFETALLEGGISRDSIKYVLATGYGRINVPFAHQTRTEILCHSKAVNRLYPSVRTVIDIGGQDSKAISITPEGNVKQFLMNEKCAAGTGRFLEVMSRALDIDLGQWGDHVTESKKTAFITNFCTVFAESEVISRAAQGVPIDELLAGICYAIASRVGQLVQRVGLEPDICFTGGVALNSGVTAKMAEFLDVSLIIPDDPQFTGAMGAAFLAQDIYHRQQTSLKT